MRMSTDFVTEPSELVAVTLTVYEPELEYVWVTSAPVDEMFPSPKSHLTTEAFSAETWNSKLYGLLELTV